MLNFVETLIQRPIKAIFPIVRAKPATLWRVLVFGFGETFEIWGLSHDFPLNSSRAKIAEIGSNPNFAALATPQPTQRPSKTCTLPQRSHGMTGGIPGMLGIWSLCENNSACGTDARGRLSCCGALPSALNCERIMITFCMGCHLVTLVASLCLSALSQVLVI
jgi:hypothetical protein